MTGNSGSVLTSADTDTVPGDLSCEDIIAAVSCSLSTLQLLTSSMISPVSLGLALLVTSAHGVAIEEVLVPAVVEAGAEEAVLDCPFTFSQEEEDQLEVRWFFNSSPTPFYQWSPGMGDLGPQVKRRVDICRYLAR